MASPTFVRWEGIAILLGGLVFSISIALSWFVPGPLGIPGPPPIWDAWLGAISGLVWIIGLPALYIVQSKRASLVGLLGIITLVVALLLLAVVLDVIPAILFATTPSDSLRQPPPFVLVIDLVGSLFLLVGSFLFGTAILLAKVFASWTAWALIVLAVVSTVFSFLPSAGALLLRSIASILFVLLSMWLGYKLVFQTSTFVGETGEIAGTSEPSATV